MFYYLGIWGFAVLNAALGVMALRFLCRRLEKRGPVGRLGVVPLLLALCVAGIGAFAVGSLFVSVGVLHIFSLVMFWYANVVVVPAVLGVAAYWIAWKGNPLRLTANARVLGILLFLPPPLCAYATFIEPYQLQLERAEMKISGMESAQTPIRIAVLADIQTDSIGTHEERAVDMALATDPDMIVLPGDFFQGSDEEFEAVLPSYRALLSRLHAPGGVFACPGNIDRLDRLIRLFEGTSVCFLNNEVVTVKLAGITIAIGGVENRFYHAAGKEMVQVLSNTESDVRILLAHLPDAASPRTSADHIDLIISGHTHGGQVVIPGLGPLITATSVPRTVGAGGLHRVGEQWIYVSRGVGFERAGAPPMRFNCPPEVSLITLQAGE